MSDSNSIHELFVYGTLMSHFDNPMAYYLLQNSQPIGIGRMKASLFDAGEFAVATKGGQPTGWIHGEIHSIVSGNYQKVIDMLDLYQRFDMNRPTESLFVRSTVQVEIAENQKIPCQTYLYLGVTENLPKIEDGNWISHIESKGRKFY